MREGGAYSAAPTAASIVLWVLPVLFLGGAALLSSQILQERVSPANAEEAHSPGDSLLFMISKNPAFTFGFHNLLGDLAWLSAVQVAGSRDLSPGEYDRLYVLLKTVGNFDPRFVVPYILGGMLLGHSPLHVHEAIDILERGAKSHPTDWRFPFYIGYTRYFSLGDPLEGAKALEEAARLPDSPSYLPFLASRMFAEGRAPETALALLMRMVSEETDPARIEILERRIREVIVERDVQDLERAVAAYRERTGSVPDALADLVGEGLIRRVPGEPNGGHYILAADGTVRSDRVASRLKVFRKR